MQRGVHLFLIEAALLRQPDVAAHLLKQFDAAQLIFQMVDGAAQGRLGDAQPGCCQGVMLHLSQHGKVAQIVVVHTNTSRIYR